MGFASVDGLEEALLGAVLPAAARASPRRSSSPSPSTSRCSWRARPAWARRSSRSRSRGRRGARLIRLQCYEGLDVSHAVYEWNYARQLLHIRAAQEGTVDEQELFGPEFLIRRPLLEAIGVRRAGRPAHRRDRPRRRRVRGVPPRGPLRLPDHDPGDRHDHARRAARRHPHVQPHPRAARRAQAPLPLPLDHAPVARARDRDRPPAGSRRVRSASPRRPRRSSPACASSTWPRRPASRRRSTGRRRSSRSAARSSTRPSSSRRSARCSSTTRTSSCSATRRCSRCSARRAPRRRRHVSEALTRHIVTFGRVLREAGMEVGPGRVADALRGPRPPRHHLAGGRLLDAAHDARDAARGPRDVRPRVRRVVPAPCGPGARRPARSTRADAQERAADPPRPAVGARGRAGRGRAGLDRPQRPRGAARARTSRR